MSAYRFEDGVVVLEERARGTVESEIANILYTPLLRIRDAILRVNVLLPIRGIFYQHSVR